VKVAARCSAHKAQREQRQQHDVERQNIHVDGGEFQQQRLHDRDIGGLQKIENVHFLGVERVLERARDMGDFSHEDRE